MARTSLVRNFHLHETRELRFKNNAWKQPEAVILKICVGRAPSPRGEQAAARDLCADADTVRNHTRREPTIRGQHIEMAHLRRGQKVEDHFADLAAQVAMLRSKEGDGEYRFLVMQLAEVVERMRRLSSSGRSNAAARETGETHDHVRSDGGRGTDRRDFKADKENVRGTECNLNGVSWARSSTNTLEHDARDDGDDVLLQQLLLDSPDISGLDGRMMWEKSWPLNDVGEVVAKRVFRKTPMRAKPISQPASGEPANCQQSEARESARPEPPVTEVTAPTELERESKSPWLAILAETRARRSRGTPSA